ncbi:MAG: hypothetical protein HXX17_05820 [Geobacteraceae bacterium]|nr:hypothetical protein [Geobacteraceae bacterium]
MINSVHKQHTRKACRLFGKSALLLGFLALPVNAMAAPPVLSVFYSSQDLFSIHANNLNRMVEAELVLSYQSDNPGPPQITNLLQNIKVTDKNKKVAAVEFRTLSSPGTIMIMLISKIPLSGYVPLALAKVVGTVSSMTALLRYENGTTEVPHVVITNPSQEQLAETAALKSATGQPLNAATTGSVQSPAVRSSGSDTRIQSPSDDVSSGGVPATTPATAPVNESRPAPSPETARQFSQPDAVISAGNTGEPKTGPAVYNVIRRESLLDRFTAEPGEGTAAVLEELLLRNNDGFLQDPPLVLSDGRSALIVTLPSNGVESPKFFITGGHCTNFIINKSGVWSLEIVPERGAKTVLVTEMSGRVSIEYQLNVAPPLESFAFETSSSVLAEFVRAANNLLSLKKP